MYSELIVQKVGKRYWRLKKDFKTPFVTVPENFHTDGASIPRFAWVFADPAGELFEAAIVHDYMYKNAIHSKKKADLAFYWTAMQYKVTPWKAKVAYYSVRLFGRGNYGKELHI